MHSDLIALFQATRQQTEELCTSLEVEDYCVQTCPDVSPPKWHLGHTSWFFETFILEPHCSHYQALNNSYSFVFNSYYNSFGERIKRDTRFLASRPTVRQTMEYRQHITNQVVEFFKTQPEGSELYTLLRIGIEHEQQHQELLSMDIQSIIAHNPIEVVLEKAPYTVHSRPAEVTWVSHKGGLHTFGQDYENGFCFDNETPQHKAYIAPFAIADRLVTNEEYMEFLNFGYKSSEFWLDDGWSWVQKERVEAPLYWFQNNQTWYRKTPHGHIPLDMNAPVQHISFYEAQAYATWRKCRLPREYEWEHAATQQSLPMTGQLWEWTESAYGPYPGYKQPQGALGEYNGKFMCNQMVLRGGCFATPKGHIRPTYRNFFYPHQRWMYSGIRLVKDV